MSHKLAKEERRNLKSTIGETAAAAVADVRQIADHTANEMRILAKQMLSFDVALSAAREARSADKQAIAGLQEQVKNLAARLEMERTHRLELAKDQRSYVDGVDRSLERRVLTQEQLFDGFLVMTFGQRLRWVLRGK